MNVIVNLCIIPIGVGVSLSPYIAACEKILAGGAVKCELHANGTNIEGEWDTVFALIKRCHEALHDMGAPRIHTTVSAGTRMDRHQTMEDKIESVKSALGEL